MKNQKGITLIALIITIIVMLILVGVSVSVAINTGLFKTASGVSKDTEDEKTNELKISGGQANLNNEYTDIEQYVESLKGDSGGDKEYILGAEGDPYIGYYAYVDGEIGIIYADFAHSVPNGSWGSYIYSYEAGTDFKDYYVSGKYEEGPFPANDILIAEGDGNDRFLIMALEDISESAYTWYNSKWENELDVDDAAIGISPDGIGKTNTKNMCRIWKTDTNPDKFNTDIWAQIGEESNWFVPSRDEWLAFNESFSIYTSAESDAYGLAPYYWTSSLYSHCEAYYVDFQNEDIQYTLSGNELECKNSVRLSATFWFIDFGKIINYTK